MADMVTVQELENAKIDARTIGEAVNENKIVTPRYGAPFKSVPMIAEEMQSVIGTIIAGGVPASIVLDGNQTQDEINLYSGKKYDTPIGGYPIGAKVLLNDNVTEVVSTVTGNTANPNSDMTGWKKKEIDASQVILTGGSNLQQIYDSRAIRSVESFGADTTGANASDSALADGLAWSAASGGILLINGKVRITQTVNQPLNSAVACTGIVFCTDTVLLTDGWMWDVNHGGGVSNKTRIDTLILSASQSADTVTNRNMKGLRVRSPSVKVGTVKTYGCLDAGVEFGPTGYEIFADAISCNIGAYVGNTTALGFNMSTTDCGVQNLTSMGYPIGANLGSTNFADNIHVWGYPATTSASEYQNKQMLTGVIFGASTRANYVYVDTPDTQLYDTLPLGNTGVAVVFNNWENSIGALYVRVHPQSKPNKIKLIRYKGQSNSIDYLHPNGAFNTTSPIIYDAPAYQWKNSINFSTQVSNINSFSYDVNGLLPTGVTQAAGTMSVKKLGSVISVYLYYTIQAVDISVTGDFKVPLPSGLSVGGAISGGLNDRSCLSQHASATGGMDFASTNGASQLIIKQRNPDTGKAFIHQNSQLRVGALEVSIRL